MFADLIAGLCRYGTDQLVKIVALEEGHASAVLAEQQVLMTVTRGDKCLAAFGLVDALNEVQFFQFLQRAIHGHQAEGAIGFPRRIVDLDGGERPRAFGDRFDDRAPRLGQPVAILVELGKPGLCKHNVK